jgi:phosphohistidine phosphatase SixA
MKRCPATRIPTFAYAIATVLLMTTATSAQTLSGEALVKALQKGGYVIVMRHASSPREAPDKQTANADNTKLERQLDEEGRTTATAMGQAFRDLKIPVGEVLSSPTYRALETVKYAQFGHAQPRPELGNDPKGMSGGTEAQTAWLKQQVTRFPKGTNTILVTHMPNMRGAFPQDAAGLADGEAFVFGPDSKGGAVLLAKVKVEEWPQLRP